MSDYSVNKCIINHLADKSGKRAEGTLSSDDQRHPVLQGIEFGMGVWSWGDRLFWGYGSDYHEKEVKEAFEWSVNAGVRFFDTAETYGQGQSEVILGELIKRTPIKLRVATKFMPYPWRLTRGSFRRALTASLNRLGLEKVDLYQMHWPTPPVKVENWMDAMVEAVQSGRIEAVGVSNYNRNQVEKAANRLEHEGIRLASNQIEVNLLNRRNEKNNLIKYCLDRGIAVIAYSPLAQGLLTGKYTPQNPPGGIRGNRYGRLYLARIQPLITQMKKIGSDHGGKTAGQVAINWVTTKGAIPIPGAKTITQAEQNFGATGWQLSPDEIALLDEWSDRILM